MDYRKLDKEVKVKMKKSYKINTERLYNIVNKRWIGHIYVYSIFILFVSLGIIIGSVVDIWFVNIAIWLTGITLTIIYPFSLILILLRNKHKKTELENG